MLGVQLSSVIGLLERFIQVREYSVACAQQLESDDYCLQAAPFTSPPKWHLAHTTWFFETFLLKAYLAEYQTQSAVFPVLFNSYYNGIGEQFARPKRGLLSRPTIEEVLTYRKLVDEGVHELLSNESHPEWADIQSRLRLGLEHERQHQELFFTDIKYSLSQNPLYPCYCKPELVSPSENVSFVWRRFEGGLIECGGVDGGGSFCFDNELPHHRVWVEPFELANRLVTNREYQLFIDDGGYERSELWLSDGWAMVQSKNWISPLYWIEKCGEAMEYSLYGLIPLDPNVPVSHISAYEADAYARWSGARLASEFEWEHAVNTNLPEVNSANINWLHPQPPIDGKGLLQCYNACWQWTKSSYSPYPGYSPAEGAIGEYNGKFMANQLVLRGGSVVTHADHVRPTYRNFLYPCDRWQFTGIRLARDV